MAAYTVKQIDLTNRRQVSDFLCLPGRVYRGSPYWVAPLRGEARRMLDPRRNPYFKHSQAAFFLAYDQAGEVVARLACLDHRLYNEHNHDKTVFFHLFEALDLPGVSLPLFEAAGEWARARGLERLLGPKGFSMLDGMGLLSEGFDYLPGMGMPYNPAYYIRLVEEAGFQVKEEIVTGYMNKGAFEDPKVALIAARVQERKGLTITHFHNRRELRQLVTQIPGLYNEAIQGTTGNYPLTPEDAKQMAGQLLWFADPSLIKLIMKGRRPVGFQIAYPNISSAMKRIQGRLFPFGWLTLLHALRTTRNAEVNGMGMIEEFRGSGGTAILMHESRKAVEKRYTYCELEQIGTTNEKMLRELSNFGVIFHKKYRLYERSIV